MSEQLDQAGQPTVPANKKFNKKLAAIIAGSVLVAFSCTLLGVHFFGGQWVAKIDRKKVSLSEFNNIYYAQTRMMYDVTNAEIDKIASDPNEVKRNPLLSKAEFLNEFIKSRVLYQKAVSEGFDKDEELEAMIDFQLKQLVSNYYVIKVSKDKIKITDQEVAETYKQYQDQLRGMPIEEAENRIRQQLKQQKLMTEQNRKLQEIKDASQIDRNDEIIGKLSDADKTKHPKSGNVVKINGKNITSKSISVKEFNTAYYAQHKFVYKTDEAGIDKMAQDPMAVQQNPMLNRRGFLDQMVYQYLFYEDARHAGMLKDPDVIALTTIMNEQFLGLYYVKKKYAKELEVTEQELSDEYNKLKGRIPPNVLPEQAELYIRQQLEQQKLNTKVPQVMNSLRERAYVEKNVSLIEKK